MDFQDIFSMFSSGEEIEGKKIVKKLGDHACGSSYLVLSHDNRPQVIKLFLANLVSKETFQQQVTVFSKIVNSHSSPKGFVLLPQKSYSFARSERNFFYLCEQYGPGGNLNQFLESQDKKKLSCQQIFFILQQMAEILSSYQDHQLVHGNITVENVILFPQGKIGLSGFGVGTLAKEPREDFSYIAPEVLTKGTFSAQSDIWSLGVVLYYLMTGKFPFRGKTREEIYLQMKQGVSLEEENFDIEPNSPFNSLVYFVQRMLSFQAVHRPKAKEVLVALKKCRQIISPEKMGHVESDVISYVKQQDEKISSLIEKDQPFTSKDSPLWEQHGAVEDSKPSVSRVFALVVMFLVLLLAYKPQQLPKLFLQVFPVYDQYEASLELKPIGEQFDFRFHLAAILRKNSQRLDISSIRRHQVDFFFCFESEHGASQAEQIPWKEPFLGEYVWEVPENFPQGKVQVWANIKLRHKEIELRSNAVDIDLSAALSDRKKFYTAKEQESILSANEEQYEKIYQIYEEYLEYYPEGLFRGKAEEKAQHYQEMFLLMEYQKLFEEIQKSAEDVEQVLQLCQGFLDKHSYPSEAYKEVVQTKKVYERLQTATSYKVTLKNAGFSNKVLQADSFVKVFHNDKEIFQSSVIENNNRPKWNVDFTIDWKMEDKVRVELWDKNVNFFVQDKKYFSVERSDVISIAALNKRHAQSGNWVEIEVDFPFSDYPFLIK